MTVLEDIMVN